MEVEVESQASGIFCVNSKIIDCFHFASFKVKKLITDNPVKKIEIYISFLEEFTHSDSNWLMNFICLFQYHPKSLTTKEVFSCIPSFVLKSLSILGFLEGRHGLYNKNLALIWENALQRYKCNNHASSQYLFSIVGQFQGPELIFLHIQKISSS